MKNNQVTVFFHNEESLKATSFFLSEVFDWQAELGARVTTMNLTTQTTKALVQLLRLSGNVAIDINGGGKRGKFDAKQDVTTVTFKKA